MYTLSEQQIDFILDDLRRQGIKLEDLQYNLLDHICCLIENEFDGNGDFEQCYRSVISRFYETRLTELEAETHALLIFKHYYTMKQLMTGSGWLSVILLGAGITFKFLHAPGAAACIATGILLLSCCFLPLYFTFKIKESSSVRNKVLFGFTLLISVLFSLAVLFKIMYWPGANAMGISALLLLLFGYLPIFVVTGIRNPETKMQTLMTAFLIFTGCALFLTLVKSPKASENESLQQVAQLERMEMLVQLQYKEFKQDPTNMAQYNLVQECEQLRTKLLLKLTGNQAIHQGVACKELPFQNITVYAVILKDPELNDLASKLKNQLKTFNQSRMQLGKQPIRDDIRLNEPASESVLDALQAIMQIELLAIKA